MHKGTFNGVDVAIKEIIDNQTEMVELFTAFQREAQIMSCLDHPNVVKLIGVITTEPMCLIMEFVPGGTLFDHLVNQEVNDSQFPWKLRFRIALDIAKGLQHLHSISPPFIHRDLRSPNILVIFIIIFYFHDYWIIDFFNSFYH